MYTKREIAAARKIFKQAYGINCPISDEAVEENIDNMKRRAGDGGSFDCIAGPIIAKLGMAGII